MPQKNKQDKPRTSRHRVLCQKWEESEAGWGTRPDGYSLHRSEEDRKRFVKAHWDGMPATPPSEYSRPDGTPYWCLVDNKTYRAIVASAHGIRRHGPMPGNGGTDGWMPVSVGHARCSLVA